MYDSKDKLGRMYGSDYLKEYVKLNNYANARLKFLTHTFPDLCSNLGNNVDLKYKINFIICVEKQIQEKYHNVHVQGELF